MSLLIANGKLCISDNGKLYIYSLDCCITTYKCNINEGVYTCDKDAAGEYATKELCLAACHPPCTCDTSHTEGGDCSDISHPPGSTWHCNDSDPNNCFWECNPPVCPPCDDSHEEGAICTPGTPVEHVIYQWHCNLTPGSCGWECIPCLPNPPDPPTTPPFYPECVSPHWWYWNTCICLWWCCFGSWDTPKECPPESSAAWNATCCLWEYIGGDNPKHCDTPGRDVIWNAALCDWVNGAVINKDCPPGSSAGWDIDLCSWFYTPGANPKNCPPGKDGHWHPTLCDWIYDIDVPYEACNPGCHVSWDPANCYWVQTYDSPQPPDSACYGGNGAWVWSSVSCTWLCMEPWPPPPPGPCPPGQHYNRAGVCINNCPDPGCPDGKTWDDVDCVCGGKCTNPDPDPTFVCDTPPPHFINPGWRCRDPITCVWGCCYNHEPEPYPCDPPPPPPPQEQCNGTWVYDGNPPICYRCEENEPCYPGHQYPGVWFWNGSSWVCTCPNPLDDPPNTCLCNNGLAGHSSWQWNSDICEWVCPPSPGPTPCVDTGGSGAGPAQLRFSLYVPCCNTLSIDLAPGSGYGRIIINGINYGTHASIPFSAPGSVAVRIDFNYSNHPACPGCPWNWTAYCTNCT